MSAALSQRFHLIHKGVVRYTSTVGRWWQLLHKEAAKFGVVGGLAFLIDNGVYAYLQYGWLGPSAGPLQGHIKISTVVATAVATVFAWMGSRYWTFRAKRTTHPTRELLQFGFFNLIGALITLASVMIAVDLLGLRGLGWETLARNSGIVLGTLFRFWAYRTFVFRVELAQASLSVADPQLTSGAMLSLETSTSHHASGGGLAPALSLAADEPAVLPKSA